jgi:hypothetical protein
LTDSVSEVDVADPEDVKALITSGSSDILVHFGEDAFLKRYQEFEGHLQEWKQQYPKLASADMRYGGQIVLEMQGDGKAAAVGTGAVETASVASPVPVMAKPVAEAKPVASVKPPAPKPVAAKPAAVNVAASKPPVVKPAVVNVAASKPPVVKPDFSHAAMPKAAAPKPVVLNADAPKPGAPKAVAAPKLVAASRPAAKKVVAKPVSGKPKPGSGMSAANEKVFARLAAEHQAELAKEHKAGTVSVAKNGKAGAKNGATP